MLLDNSLIQGLLTTRLSQSDRMFSEECAWRDVDGYGGGLVFSKPTRRTFSGGFEEDLSDNSFGHRLRPVVSRILGSRVSHFFATFDDDVIITIITMNSTVYLKNLKGVRMLYNLETTTFSYLPHICNYCLMVFHAEFVQIISPHMRISNLLVCCHQTINYICIRSTQSPFCLTVVAQNAHNQDGLAFPKVFSVIREYYCGSHRSH